MSFIYLYSGLTPPPSPCFHTTSFLSCHIFIFIQSLFPPRFPHSPSAFRRHSSPRQTSRPATSSPLKKIKDETGTSLVSSDLPTELFFPNLNNYGSVFTCFLVSQHADWLARYCPLQHIFMPAADRMGWLNQLLMNSAVRKLHRLLVSRWRLAF